ncbi:VOC family protein [Methylocystis sp. ATCC 49242]|uniref:VOC family protein n=1 Tax=Methylocystis sp. ATCC 49242 TaxID=622637 RepID=UPI0001F886BD|nr:VOC family protein [Methylocystis sp. ATCC 49242]
MTIVRMDHFTILTRDAKGSAAFYGDILGLAPGPRPAFDFPGAWLYAGERAALHLVERPDAPAGGGVLDHVAFWGEGLPACLEKLRARDVAYELRRLPEGGHCAGVWQLFFLDPNGAKIEVDFAAAESPGV